MGQNRSRAMVAYERVLVRLALESREPTAWEEGNLLEALVAITSGDYHTAVEYIAAAARRPTASELASIGSHRLLSRVEIRDRFEELRDATLFHDSISRYPAHSLIGMVTRSSAASLGSVMTIGAPPEKRP